MTPADPTDMVPAFRTPLSMVRGGCGLAALLLLALSIVGGCGTDTAAPAARGLPPAEEPSTRTVTRFATASVLIVGDSNAAAAALDRIVFSPDPLVLDVGESVQLSATAIDAAGRSLDHVDFVWATGDPRAGFVDSDGWFVAGSSPGTFESAISVTVVLKEFEATAYQNRLVPAIVVGERQTARLAKVTIFPESPTVLDQQIYRLRATAFDPNGLLIPGVSLQWKLNDPSLGRLSPTGFLTVSGGEGLYYDAVTVSATLGGRTVSATTNVDVVRTPRTDEFMTVEALPQRFFLDPGERMQLRAVALNGLGELISGTVLRWSVSDPAAGTIDGQGVFLAGQTPGIYTEAVLVEAIVPGERGFVRAVDFASVVIREERGSRYMAALAIIPESVSLGPGERAILIVRSTDEGGRPVEGIEIEWRMLDPRAGKVDVNGGFQASDDPGIYPESVQVVITQEIDGIATTMAETVGVTIAGSMARAEVQPELVTLAPGQSVRLLVIAVDENGARLPGLSVEWAVSDESIGTIDSFGNFTAGDVTGMFADAITVRLVQTLPNGS